MTFSKWMRIVLPVGGLFSYCFYFLFKSNDIWWIENLWEICIQWLIMIVVAMCTYRDYTILDCFSVSNNHTDGLSDELLWHGRSKIPIELVATEYRVQPVFLFNVRVTIFAPHTHHFVSFYVYINMFWLLVMFRLRCLLNSSAIDSTLIIWFFE